MGDCPNCALPMKIVSQCREQARCVYYESVFEIKTEDTNYSVGYAAAVMNDAAEVKPRKGAHLNSCQLDVHW